MSIDTKVVEILGQLIYPASNKRILEIQEKFNPFRFSNELKQFYSVTNGIEGIEFTETVSIESLESAFRFKEHYQQYFADDEQNLLFPPALFPFIETNGGHLFAVLCTEQKETSSLVEWYVEDNYMSLQHESLRAYFETKYEQKRFLDLPSGKQFEIALESYGGSKPLRSKESMSNEFKNKLINRALFKFQKSNSPNAFDEFFEIDEIAASDLSNYFEIDNLPDTWFG